MAPPSSLAERNGHLMHPRNPYRQKKLQLQELLRRDSRLSPFLRKVKGRHGSTGDGAGEILVVDWKDENAMIALTRALLLGDFGLRWELPTGRLCPTVPSRLNYLLWLQDLLHQGGEGPSLGVNSGQHACHGQSSEHVADASEMGSGTNFSVDAPNLERAPILDHGDARTRRGEIRCIDIGCGANCIYPLLGVEVLGWRFIGTEVDPESVAAARQNVGFNHMEERIEIRQVPLDKIARGSGAYPAVALPCVRPPKSMRDGEDRTADPAVSADDDLPPLLCGVLVDGETADACMCNPPFYDDGEVARGRGDLGVRRAASRLEQFTPGGEVGFVRRLIADSLVLRARVTWYTSLLGKKASLRPLKRLLRESGVPYVCSTELSQGVTSRWVLAWSFVRAPSVAVEQLAKAAARAAKRGPPLSKEFEVKSIALDQAVQRAKEFFAEQNCVVNEQESDSQNAACEENIDATTGRACQFVGQFGARAPAVASDQSAPDHRGSGVSTPPEKKARPATEECAEHGAADAVQSSSSICGTHRNKHPQPCRAKQSAPFAFEVRFTPLELSESEDEVFSREGVEKADSTASRLAAGASTRVRVELLQDDAAPEQSEGEAIMNFYKFAENLRNDIVRDTRKWRRKLVSKHLDS